MIKNNISQAKCVPCEGGIDKLTREEVEPYLKSLGDWAITSDRGTVYKDFKFQGFGKTMMFVNAVAWIAQTQMHHPDLEVGYNHCLVKFTTHAIKGLSINDFICAKKVNDLSV